MPTTIYSNTTWPLLQGMTKTRFPSGLLSLSAQYIRPAGSTATISDIDGYPLAAQPSVTSANDGFEQIDATAYGYWSGGVTEEIFNISVYKMPVLWSANNNPYERSISVLVESGWVKGIGSQLRELSRPLEIINPTWYDILEFNPLFETGWSGNFNSIQPILRQELSFATRNVFGAAVETEATYTITPYLDFGNFTST